jgi:apolipoprotein N-acyltransferase
MLGGATWVGLEIARAHLLGGYPWGLLGHTQWQRLELIQLADVTGVYGLSFVIVAVNVAAADALEAARRRRSRELPVSCVIAFSLVAGTFLYGAWRLTNAVPPTATVRVQIVHTAWTEQGPESAERLFRHLIELTSAVPPQNAELVVWPENSIRFYVQVAPQATESIGRLLSPRNQYLLAGGPHYGRDGSGWIYHNSAHLFDAQGQIVGRHDKSLLVPLAEEAIGALPSVERAFRRGSDTHPLHAGRSSLGVLVCFEAIYPQLARRLVLQGANVLVNVTNDHLIGAGAAQQAAMAVFRAVENRVPLIRVSNLGPSLTVDPFGRVATLPASQPGSVVSTLTLASGATPYNQVGDLFAFACAAISLACVVGRARTFVRGTVRTIGRISSSQ